MLREGGMLLLTATFLVALMPAAPVWAEEEAKADAQPVLRVEERTIAESLQQDPGLLNDTKRELVLALGKEQTTNNVKWVSTGVDSDSRAEAGKFKHSLCLKFAQGRDWLSFVDVTISDAAGAEVISTKSAGPWLFVDLPPGTYAYKATSGEVSRSGSVTIPAGGKQQTVLLRWPGTGED